MALLNQRGEYPMPRPSLHRFRAALLAGSAALALSPGSALAQQEGRAAYNIPAQDLGTALTQFGQQSEREIVFSADLTRNRKAPTLVGELTSDQALRLLLADSGLTYRTTPGGSIIVEPEGGSSPQSASAGGDIEALIVTAQKREENIQDVPIAISAFTQEALETHQIAGGPDLITQVPNMTFTKTNFSSYSIQLRGIGTQAISATTDPGVAVAFNNTPFIQNRFFEQEFYDLQRVEVLRGPQGTLYGRNATAGVVNIISAKPKFVYEAKLSGDVSNYNSTRVEGMVNIPLVEDAVAMRLAGAWTKRDGYAFNQLSGGPIDGRDLWSTRLSLRVSPNSALDINLIWEHFEENDDRLRSGKQLCKKHVVSELGDITDIPFGEKLRDGGLQAVWVAVQPRFSTGCERTSLYSDEAFQTPNGASVPWYVPIGAVGGRPAFFDPYVSQEQSRDLRVIESARDPEYRAMADLGELQISWDVTDRLTLTSETAYAADEVWSMQDFNRFNTVEGAFCVSGMNLYSVDNICTNVDAENSPYVEAGVLDADGVFCDPQIGCTSRLAALDLSTAVSRQFNQEFRLSSDFDGPFNFSLGANFTRFDLEAKYYVFINHLTLSSLGNEYFNGGAPYDLDSPYNDDDQCSSIGALRADPNTGGLNYICIHTELNSLYNLEDQGHNYFLSKNPYKLISYAAFGEAYYEFTDNLKVTGGLRWTVDKKYAPRIPSWTFVGSSRGYPVLEVIEQEWREPTGRLAIDWKPELAFTDETMVYASYAHGYKAGGANPPPYVAIYDERGGQGHSATRPKTFEAEYIDAFELGSKNTLLDGTVTLNLAAFYYDYTDYQISEIVDRAAYNHNYDATVWGLEIEADWRPLENLKLSFKGGYEHARFKDGELAIDLMDRTAGDPNWVTVRPFPTAPSNCIFPLALYTHHGLLPQGPGEDPIDLGPGNPSGSIFDMGETGGNVAGAGCERAYRDGNDPVTNAPYASPPPGGYPAGLGQTFLWGPQGTYPGWNPAWAPNNGEGFFKNLGGNPLPNAPDFTATLSVDYTLPLPNDWLATLHTDLYWQSESNWRIFDDHEFSRLDEYFTMNAAAIFTNEEAGWRVMAYVKNVFDRDSITGAFLNSDDTALTANVFLTEPRLYGLRVTKAWTGGPLLGSFGERRDGPSPFTVELGRQVQRHDAPNAALTPSFLGEFSPELDPLADQQDDLNWGDGREVKLTWRPDDAWQVAIGTRFGKTKGAVPWSERKRPSGAEWGPEGAEGAYGSTITDLYTYTISSTADREEHTIIDFTVGRDFGMGMAGENSSSALSAGLRYAELTSETSAHIFGPTNWVQGDRDFLNKYPDPTTHDRFEGEFSADREFKGVGPVLSWEASAALLGDRDVGVLGLDWSVTGGVLFGKRKALVTGEEFKEEFSDDAIYPFPLIPDTTTDLASVNSQREEDVTVPTFGASLGVSYRIDRFAIGAGYRWERYQDAIDGGYAETQEEDRTIDGPYFKVSLGFGG